MDKLTYKAKITALTEDSFGWNANNVDEVKDTVKQIIKENKLTIGDDIEVVINILSEGD
jgi:hypothetical protein